jgi:Bacterial low temperature requirement A protein (LtrA)
VAPHEHAERRHAERADGQSDAWCVVERTYFDRVAGEAEDRLGAHKEPVLAAADAYSYLHLLLVSGIIVSAIGLEAAVGHVAEPPAFGVPSCRSAAIRGSERAIVRCS